MFIYERVNIQVHGSDLSYPENLMARRLSAETLERALAGTTRRMARGWLKGSRRERADFVVVVPLFWMTNL